MKDGHAPPQSPARLAAIEAQRALERTQRQTTAHRVPSRGQVPTRSSALSLLRRFVASTATPSRRSSSAQSPLPPLLPPTGCNRREALARELAEVENQLGTSSRQGRAEALPAVQTRPGTSAGRPLARAPAASLPHSRPATAAGAQGAAANGGAGEAASTNAAPRSPFAVPRPSPIASRSRSSVREGTAEGWDTASAVQRRESLAALAVQPARRGYEGSMSRYLDAPEFGAGLRNNTSVKAGEPVHP